MGRVVHFELPADDVRRAVGFYREVFGWQIEDPSGEEQYFLSATGSGSAPGINGAILPRTGPVTRLVATIQVDALDQTLDRVKAGGGAVIDGKRPIPGVGWHAYCEDCEGNVIGVLQPDPAA